MKHTEIFKEARRLYKLGFAVHWLHAKSKRPIETGWTTGPRKSWDYLKETYIEGLNVGVRLGTPSKIDDCYVAVVDVDVKSEDKRHRIEAVKAALSLFRNIPKEAIASVTSGRGNGSRHYYCLTATPFKTWNPFVSDEIVKVYMPSKSPSKKEIAELTKKEIADGMRLAPAWEVSLYSDGRQVVVPPSIHPDSGKPYLWKTHIQDAGLAVIEFPDEVTEKKSKGSGKDAIKDYSGVTLSDFVAEDVNLDWLSISAKVKSAIKDGVGVTDRSGYLLRAATALLSAGCTKNEILSVLTDTKTFLGHCAYDHAKTKSRDRAAYWVWKYTVEKVVGERSPELLFRNTAVARPAKLSAEDMAEQQSELTPEADWRELLETTEKGKYRNTLLNCKLILSRTCELRNIVGRNEFAAQDYYLCNTPWRSKKGDAVADHDTHRIKFFCAERFGIDFGDNVIEQSVLEIADINRFHPVRTWLQSLRWDGVNRIDTWLKVYAGAEAPEPYLSEVSRKILCALVKRIYEPGCKFDYVLILEGLQGVGKSTFLRNLIGDAWFTDAPLNIGDKDAILTMQNKWLIELGELSAMGKADLEQLKAFITQTTDRIRAPYGKRMQDYPRQSIFVGSTNLEEYLRDLTGNRRFWPVKTTSIDFGRVSEVREQLFAEAVAMYKLGEPLYLESSEVSDMAAEEQTKRMQSDDWIEIVRDIVNFETFPKNGFELRDVAKRMDSVGAHKMSLPDSHRIGRCLKLLGYEKYQERTGKRRKLWREIGFL